MTVVVPFDASEPKTRLDPLLDAEERLDFALAMLRDVLAALRETGRDPRVLATERVDVDAPVTVDSQPLTPAVNDVLAAAEEPVAIVMADLPLATPDALGRLFAPEADVVLVPGLGGGTNAILARHPDFRVDYHDASIRDHRERAAALGSTATVDSWRLSVDIDRPGDLVEVLLHGEGHARDWLREAGVSLSTGDGRVSVERD